VVADRLVAPHHDLIVVLAFPGPQGKDRRNSWSTIGRLTASTIIAIKTKTVTTTPSKFQDSFTAHVTGRTIDESLDKQYSS